MLARYISCLCFYPLRRESVGSPPAPRADSPVPFRRLKKKQSVYTLKAQFEPFHSPMVRAATTAIEGNQVLLM